MVFKANFSHYKKERFTDILFKFALNILFTFEV